MGTGARSQLTVLVLWLYPAALAYRLGDLTHSNQDRRTQGQVKCYEWRPKRLTLSPGNDSSVTVHWHPAFTASGFVVGLKPEQPGEPHQAKYTSFQSRLGVTFHTFSNLSAGRYRAWFQPTGCTDCSPTQFGDCVSHPSLSQGITLPRYKHTGERGDETHLSLLSAPTPTRLLPLVLLVCVPPILLLATILLLIVLVRRSRRKIKEGYFKAPQDSFVNQIPGGRRELDRIVLLYSKDHSLHVSAVRSLAHLLRALLHVHVLERGLDAGEESGWTEPLPTGGESVVLVVLSPGMLQLARVQEEEDDPQQVYSQVARLVYSFTNHQHMQTNRLIPVSLGYTHDCMCLMKLRKTEKSSDLTTMQNGVRVCIFSKLWRYLDVDKPLSGFENSVEGRTFLRNVDKMDHLNIVCGKWCWGHSGPGLPPEQRLDFTHETATLVSEWTDSRYVSMELLCCQPGASDTMRVSCERLSYVSSQYGLERNLCDESCVTLETLGQEQDADTPGSETGRSLHSASQYMDCLTD